MKIRVPYNPTAPASLANSATFFGVREIPQDIFDCLSFFAFPDTSEGNAELLKQALANSELAARYQNRLLKILLTHVIRGEKAEAEILTQKSPSLLLLKGRAIDYSGRTIEGTALQMALGAEDVKCHDKDDDGMVEMIHHSLKSLPNGETIIAKQTEEQFPEGWEVKEKQRAMRDSDVLNAVINTIDISDTPADWEKAIDTLRNYLAFENRSKPIQTGKHFNHQLLVAAFDLYYQHYDKFERYASDKNNIVWRKVIGTIERYVPAATAQALCTGINNIVDKKSKLHRDFALYNPHYLAMHDNHPNCIKYYFPLVDNATSILGRDFAVYSYYPGCPPSRWRGTVDPTPLQQFCQTKATNLQNLYSAHSLSQITQRPGL